MDSSFWRQPKTIFSIVAVVAILVVTLIVVVIRNGVINTGNQRQQTLIALYNDTTNVLSDCLVKTKQSVGVTRAQTDALDKVITDAVRGRYADGTTAGTGKGNPLFSAMVEAYPDLNGLSQTFDKVLIVINGCRSDFRDSQSRLQAEVATFEQWRTGSYRSRHFGGNNYPNSALVITLNDRQVTGRDALTQMRKLVVVSDAQKARDDNSIDNSDPFATP